MFTGLIETIGTITAIDAGTDGSRITVAAEAVMDDLAIGDSIAVDGACMTAVTLDDNSFSFEASPETMAKTNFHTYRPGTRVNLERPLTAKSRIGGHFVTGHVDGQAEIVSIESVGNSHIYCFAVTEPALAELLIPKGSIAILGISLTVNTVEDNRFSVAIIPHTLFHTNLSDYQVGDQVNIETDMLGKYVRRMLGGKNAEEAENVVSSPVIAAELLPAMQGLGLTPVGSGATIHTGGWFNH